MPSRNVVRNFFEDGYYHIFNRGVEKRDIFIDPQDYRIFLYYLYIYLFPLEQVLLKYPNFPIRLHNKNLFSEVSLVSYCLMPNHFHLLLHQKTKDGISKLLKQVTNAYTFYFNQKYNRAGSLVQGRFKATNLETDELLLHISRYIHLNPISADIVSNVKDYQWSSYQEYVYGKKGLIYNKDFLLSYFSSIQDYEKFVLDQENYARELDNIKHLILE